MSTQILTKNFSKNHNNDGSASSSGSKTKLTYKDAGVDVDAGNNFVKRIKSITQTTKTPGVMGDIGAFAAFFAFPSKQYQEPVLVSSTDGVGTKLKLALAMHQHTTIGIDLVAMCANDIICHGADPLFFLDYYACGHLEQNISTDVIKGIATGCQQAQMALVGGETAEMPGMYSGQSYDLAGFAVGVVEKSAIIDGSAVTPGNVLIGIASSGPHSNGYSLIRRILQESNTSLQQPFDNSSIGEVLLAPTRIYVQALKKLWQKVKVHAIAHITGGGILENLPRVLAPYTQAIIKKNSWQWPAIFDWLQSTGNIADEEMVRTFNCGIGMIVCVAENNLQQSLEILTEAGETAWPIGVIDSSTDSQPKTIIV